MKKKYQALTIALSIGATSLYAGTMGEVNYTMDGLYLGLGTGLNTLFTKDSFTTTRASGLGGDSDTNRYTNSSVLFTGDVGYGKMVQPKVYLGVKGSIYYTPLNNLSETGFSSPGGTVLIVGNNSINTQLQPIYNIDAVLGYEVWNHVLPFVEAGVSFADIHNNYVIKRTRSNLNGSSNPVKYQYGINLDSYKTGFNVGIGTHYQPHPHWILASELVYNYLGKSSGNASVSIPNTTDTEYQTRTITGNNVALFCSVSYLMNV